MAELAIHSIIRGSEVNGPGNRYVLWTQGCSKGCKGCFNPETWKFSRWKNLSSPWALAQDVRVSGLEGLTLTGGDPLEQPEALLEFLRELHKDDSELSFLPRGIICFTGYTLDEVEQIPAAYDCLNYIDLLIDGRYVEELRFSDALAGSSNQQFHFSQSPGRGKDRISPDEVLIDQSVEVHATSTPGEVEITGFPVISKEWLTQHGLRLIS